MLIDEWVNMAADHENDIGGVIKKHIGPLSFSEWTGAYAFEQQQYEWNVRANQDDLIDNLEALFTRYYIEHYDSEADELDLDWLGFCFGTGWINQSWYDISEYEDGGGWPQDYLPTYEEVVDVDVDLEDMSDWFWMIGACNPPPL